MFGIKTRLQQLGRKVFREYISRDPRDRMIPPPEMIYVGLGDFKAVGQAHVGYFIADGALRPDHRVLDVGCGVGRMAIPLTQYLGPAGSYQGFDVVEAAIDWCRKAITPRYPNFKFDFFDLYNGAYNLASGHKTSDFRFPYESESFDFICAVSVFTHLVFDDTENYLHEFARLLKPGGRAFASYYIYDEEAARLVAEGRTSLPFLYDHGAVRTVDPDEPEHATAYTPDQLDSLYLEAGMKILEPIKKGMWCDRSSGFEYQDMVISQRDCGGCVTAVNGARSRASARD